MKINFIGDIYLNKKIEISKDVDLKNVILNLEAPFNNRGIPAKNKVNLYMDSNHFFDSFCNNNILAVNLANNHIMDYGEESFKDTLEILNKKNIPYFGAGTARNNFNNPLIIEEKIAFFGYSCKSTNGVFGDDTNNGSAIFEIDKVMDDIKKYKEKYFIVVSIHWGQEYYSFPKPNDVRKGRNLINSGVDLIIGHHPHNIQSYEIYKGKHIFYSLGNGIFHSDIVPSKHDGKKFLNKYTMKYKRSNRKSIKVELDLDSYYIKKEFLFYDSTNLRLLKSLYLKLKSKMILNKFLYKIYGFYKMKRLSIDYHLKRMKL